MTISELVGKTLTEVRGAVGEERITFVCHDGSEYAMFHTQDCCESVSVEDIAGDFSDLIGTPIVDADERSDDTDPEGVKKEYEDESFTWTFYRLSTIKGTVVIRWYGSSNGYYSESVDFEKM